MNETQDSTSHNPEGPETPRSEKSQRVAEVRGGTGPQPTLCELLASNPYPD